MTRRRATSVAGVAGAAGLTVGGLSLATAGVTAAVGVCVGISDHGICGAAMIASAVLITGGFAADGSASALDGIIGKVVHTGMAVGIASLLLAAVGTRGFTVVGVLGLLSFAVAGIGLAAGAVTSARRSSTGMSSRDGRGNRLRPFLQRARRMHWL